jgi:hypothetical protein
MREERHPDVAWPGRDAAWLDREIGPVVDSIISVMQQAG